MSSNLIKLALKELDITQKEMAMKLGVSPAQITKWKAGEHMSHEMSEKISGFLNIGTLHPDVVVWAGSLETAEKWRTLISYLLEVAEAGSESNYVSDIFNEEEGLNSHYILGVLVRAGFELPEKFPKEIDFDYDIDMEENMEIFNYLFEEDPYSTLILDLIRAYDQLHDYYAAYIENIVFDNDADLDEVGLGLHSSLLGLALAKIGEENSLLKEFNEFRYKTVKECERLVDRIKMRAIRLSIPLRAEITELITEDPEYLWYEAERQAFGFNNSMHHPDIYMNEILEGIHTMNKVLPLICEKLGISEKELENRVYDLESVEKDSA